MFADMIMAAPLRTVHVGMAFQIIMSNPIDQMRDVYMNGATSAEGAKREAKVMHSCAHVPKILMPMSNAASFTP